jgi:hypothetical protein
LSEENDLKLRIKRLERECRRLRFATILAITLLAVFEGANVIESRPRDSITVREVLLKDESDRIVARLGRRNGATCLDIEGEAKDASAELCAGDKYGSSLSLINSGAKSRAFLTAGSKIDETTAMSDLAPSLIIAREDGKQLIRATLGPQTELLVGHGSQKDSLLLSATEDHPSITVLGNDGKSVWSALGDLNSTRGKALHH